MELRRWITGDVNGVHLTTNGDGSEFLSTDGTYKTISVSGGIPELAKGEFIKAEDSTGTMQNVFGPGADGGTYEGKILIGASQFTEMVIRGNVHIEGALTADDDITAFLGQAKDRDAKVVKTEILETELLKEKAEARGWIDLVSDYNKKIAELETELSTMEV